MLNMCQIKGGGGGIGNIGHLGSRTVGTEPECRVTSNSKGGTTGMAKSGCPSARVSIICSKSTWKHKITTCIISLFIMQSHKIFAS